MKSYLINNCKFLKLSCLKVTNVGKTVDRVMSMSPKIEGHCSKANGNIFQSDAGNASDTFGRCYKLAFIILSNVNC